MEDTNYYKEQENKLSQGITGYSHRCIMNLELHKKSECPQLKGMVEVC